jgi:hypothetical protein
MKKIKQEETEILSKLQQKGAPRKTIKETTQLTGLTKISAFFNSKHKESDDVLNLPDDVEFFSTESTEPAVTATILSSDNVQKFIEHLLSKEKPETGFASLLLRKAVLEYLSLDGNQVKSTARKLCTWSVACGIRDATDENCRERIKYYKKNADKLVDINLSDQVTYFLTHNRLMNIRNTEDLSARVRIGLTPGPKPVWGELEVQLCDFIRAQHKLRRQVTRIVVLHKALQINPQFCGGVLDPLFMKRATGFYYRFIHFYYRFIRSCV